MEAARTVAAGVGQETVAERKRQHNSAATEAQSTVVADTEDTTEKQPAVGMSKDDAEFV